MLAAAISKLDLYKAIPVIFLKKCVSQLAPALSKLYNKCFTISYFPTCWMSSYVVPVFMNSGESSELSP